MPTHTHTKDIVFSWEPAMWSQGSYLTGKVKGTISVLLTGKQYGWP